MSGESKMETFTYDALDLSEGRVVLQCPTSMTPEEHEDFVRWVEIVTRKIRRMVVYHRPQAGIQ